MLNPTEKRIISALFEAYRFSDSNMDSKSLSKYLDIPFCSLRKSRASLSQKGILIFRKMQIVESKDVAQILLSEIKFAKQEKDFLTNYIDEKGIEWYKNRVQELEHQIQLLTEKTSDNDEKGSYQPG